MNELHFCSFKPFCENFISSMLKIVHVAMLAVVKLGKKDVNFCINVNMTFLPPLSLFPTLLFLLSPSSFDPSYSLFTLSLFLFLFIYSTPSLSFFPTLIALLSPFTFDPSHSLFTLFLFYFWFLSILLIFLSLSLSFVFSLWILLTYLFSSSLPILLSYSCFLFSSFIPLFFLFL